MSRAVNRAVRCVPTGTYLSEPALFGRPVKLGQSPAVPSLTAKIHRSLVFLLLRQ